MRFFWVHLARQVKGLGAGTVLHKALRLIPGRLSRGAGRLPNNIAICQETKSARGVCASVVTGVNRLVFRASP